MKIFNWFKKGKDIPKVDRATLDMIITQRAHGLMALWAAERMGKTAEAEANYADEIVAEGIDDKDFIAKINEDLVFHEQHVEMEELEQKLSDFKIIAKLENDDETAHANKMHNLSGDC